MVPNTNSADDAISAEMNSPKPSCAGSSQSASASCGTEVMQLLPLVSTKSWWVMAVGSTWCWRKGVTKWGPKIGVRSSPTVSPAQCAIPDRMSASR